MEMKRKVILAQGLPQRRNALQAGAAAVAMAASGIIMAACQSAKAQDEAESDEEAQTESADRRAVLKAGMTEQEADCWEWTAKAAGVFFELPELHPMDKSEVASAIHIIQNKLLGRPTYRKYLAAHKSMANEESDNTGK